MSTKDYPPESKKDYGDLEGSVCVAEFTGGGGKPEYGVFWILRVSVLYLIILLLLFVRSFGLVLRQTGGVHNECHLFGEISKDWPSSILVNTINRYMTSST